MNFSEFLLILHFILCLPSFCSGESSQERKPKGSKRGDMSPTEIMKSLRETYNKLDPPSSDHPTEVRIGIYVNSFYSINEQTMDYSVNLYLRQSWLDQRLSFSHLTNTTEKFRMADHSWNSIWIPDTFFRNEKAASFHEVTIANRFLRLNRNGELWYVIKISAVFACPMNLQYYPLDSQACPIMFESFGYTSDTIKFGWLDDPVQQVTDLQLPQFSIKKKELRDCGQNYTAGYFPCLEIRFHLQREIGYFLIQVYIPSILIVILSWVSFWIHVDASPARVSIGLLTVLTTTTMSAGARATLPKVSYIKALDVWMIACLVFVFASLIEYAIVNVLARKKFANKDQGNVPTKPAESKGPKRFQGDRAKSIASTSVNVGRFANRGISALRAKSIAEQGRATPERDDIELSSLMIHRSIGSETNKSPNEFISAKQRVLALFNRVSEYVWNDKSAHDGKSRARKVDKISRKLFPISFVFFNVAYWTIYSSHYRSI
uniref:Putative GABA receptor 2 n=1 Tax=Hirudo verbana TaxID=311461 RepID=A0A2S1WLY6_9ANNE|nr:putative GABA receptor 2 [Hirudo verbana]